MDKIMEILQKNGYVTVEYLIRKIKYSPTTIRRDIALLEKQGLVKRTYGGVALVEKDKVPFTFRRHFMKKEKRAIAVEAAKLISDGDTIFLDTSTTTSYVADYILKKKDITVVTSNPKLGIFLFEHGIKTYILAGRIIGGFSSGHLVGESLDFFNIDIGFIDATGISKDGYLESRFDSGPGIIKSIRKNCRKLVVLTTGEKFDFVAKNKCISLADVDFVICESEVDIEIKENCKDTIFICTGR